jgi:antitoxin YefM
MDVLSYSDFRTNLAKQMDKVNQDHKPLLVTRQNAKSVVVMSLTDFQSYEETAYLMASPKNAERLNQAISEISQGKAQQHEIVE